jgi:hypothetical protein
MMKRTLPAVCLLLALAPWIRAQDAAQAELIQKLLTRIDSLEKRVEELEKEKSGAAVVAVAPVAPAPEVAQTRPAPAPSPVVAPHSHDTAPAPEIPPGDTLPQYPSLKIAGFGDIDYSALNLHGPSGGFGAQTLLTPHSGFEEGQFVLHLSSALSSKVTVFSEISLTARSDAGTGTPPAPGFNIELERLIIRYDLNDYFKLSFGRYHTPINYWNTAFHHGAWLQTTISRPEMIQFGGSFLPVHFVGALVEGSAPASGWNLNYNVGVGNGRGQVISRDGDFGDINNSRATLVNVFVKPDFLYGAQMGGSFYHDQLTPTTAPAAEEWIQSGHLVWAKETPEFIAEFANVTHKPNNGGVTSNSQAFYVQTAYRLPRSLKKFKPYYRFEYLRVPQSDAIFRNLVPSFSASTAGIRYDISSFAAFKAEYRNYDRRALPSFHGVFLQTSFTF